MCVCVCACAWVHTCTCRPEVNFGCHYSGSTLFILWDRDCLGFTEYWTLLAGRQVQEICLFLPSQLQAWITMPNYFMWLPGIKRRPSCLQAVHVTDGLCPCSPLFYLVSSISWLNFLLLLIPSIVFLISLNCLMMFFMSRWVSWRSSFWILLRHWADFFALQGLESCVSWMHH